MARLDKTKEKFMVTGAEAPIAYEITKTAIGALVKPAMAAAFAGLSAVTQKTVDIFSDRLTDYLSNQAEKHSCLSTIVFGHQKLLHDLYIPLTVVSATKKSGEAEEILIDRFQNDFLPKISRVIITDTAGMGKSTLSKFLFLQCLRSGYAIPFFVELRHMSEKNDIYSILLKQLNPLSSTDEEPRYNKRQLQRLLKTGNLLFFFDGYDEIPPAEREAVTISIKGLIENYPRHIYVITSRPESGLLAFPSFHQFTIRPLQREESFALIRKYDEDSTRSEQNPRDGRAEQLIKKLQGPDFSAVHEFLKNPLLTSLLYRSFEYKQSVPLKNMSFTVKFLMLYLIGMMQRRMVITLETRRALLILIHFTGCSE
jgi:NACHT domain